MSKILDFNKLNGPTLPLVMCDEAKTAITVTTPSEGLVEELETVLPELEGVFKAGDERAINAVYKLAAQFISCNLEGLGVTGEELRTKYWPKNRITNQLFLLKFCGAYMDFINEIKSAKN